MVTFVPGRKPPHPEETHPRLHLGRYLTATLLAPPPASADWYSRVADWGMLLNDQLGCCTESMVGHMIEGTSTYGAGARAQITDADVLTAYERVSGYNPADPSTDQGAVLQDVMADWEAVGVGGHRALAYAQVDVTSFLEMMQAISLFGAVALGITVTDDMMSAFNDGQPWQRYTGNEIGGHAIPAVGYDSDWLYVVTWGKVQQMSWPCFLRATEEGWITVLPEWFTSAGVDPTGLDLHALGADFSDLTGTGNPFPAPAPPPVPVPPNPVPAPPVPVPVPDAADETLAAAARGWLEHHHIGPNERFAKAVAAWLAAKNLAAEPTLED